MSEEAGGAKGEPEPASDIAPTAAPTPATPAPPRVARFKDMTAPARAALVALRVVEAGCCVAVFARPDLAMFGQLLVIFAIAWFVQHRLRTWPAARRPDAHAPPPDAP